MSGPSASLAAFIEQLERLIGDDCERRASALRTITTLFLEQSSLSDEQLDLFDEVLCRLARDIELEARVELSTHLADAQPPLRQALRQLAFDEDIAVAGPVIARCEALDDDDLVAIGQERGQGFLLAMSQRAAVSERVADVIVERGDEAVVCKLAGNAGARFSPQAFGLLLRRRLAAPAPRRSLSETEQHASDKAPLETDEPSEDDGALKRIAGGRSD
jgi:uncharacterized protein (DUF2336 family)